MNLSQLHYFCKLAKLQHYTQAAKELFITQPSLSDSISSLERELKVPLFEKKGRNVHLTKYGREFLAAIEPALEQIDRGVATMKDYAGNREGGKIDLGCIITVQNEYIPHLIQDYQGSGGSKTAFEITQKFSGPLVEDLRTGACDVVFCAKDSDSASEIVYVPVTTQTVAVAMTADSPLAQLEFVTPEDLRACQTLITYKDNIPLGKAIHKLLDRLGIYDVAYDFLDESILAGFTSCGNRTAVILDTFFLSGVKGITVLPLYNNATDRKIYQHCIYMAYNEKAYHPYCVDCFIDYVSHLYKIPPHQDDVLFID